MAIVIQGKLNTVAADGILADASQIADCVIGVNTPQERDGLSIGIRNSKSIVFVRSDSCFYKYDDGLTRWVKVTVGGDIIDDTLSTTSTNAVQNKVVTASLATKLDKVETTSEMIRVYAIDTDGSQILGEVNSNGDLIVDKI